VAQESLLQRIYGQGLSPYGRFVMRKGYHPWKTIGIEKFKCAILCSGCIDLIQGQLAGFFVRMTG
jgi:hypothetical protein